MNETETILFVNTECLENLSPQWKGWLWNSQLWGHHYDEVHLLSATPVLHWSTVHSAECPQLTGQRVDGPGHTFIVAIMDLQ